MATAPKTYYATGKRKTSKARVHLKTGSGKITINNRELQEYFPREAYQRSVLQPLTLTDTKDQLDANLNIKGGGLTGQAEAARHGIARALLEYNAELRGDLKKAGLLTRDPREVERKKYGLAKARKRYQYSKR